MKAQLKHITFTLVSLLSLVACSTPKQETPKEEDPPIVDPDKDKEPEEPVEKTNVEKYKCSKETSLIADTHFKNGFYLISPESTNQYWERDLDYNGEAEKDLYEKPDAEHTPYWQMCQWWTPFNFKDATYEKQNGVHVYQNESRRFAIDTSKGELVMEQDSYLEYQERFGRKRQGNESWSHFLIQQVFPNGLQKTCAEVSGDNSLHASIDFSIDEATFKGDPETQSGVDCAQFMFYIQIINDVPDGSNPDEVGKKGTKMWFGLPLFDSRYGIVPSYIGGDTGFEGATNRLIYSISSSEYLKQGTTVGQKYSLDIDITEYLQQAFIYGVQNGYLTNCKWPNMKIYYMNLGWELPGEYKVKSTISNLDIYYLQN